MHNNPSIYSKVDYSASHGVVSGQKVEHGTKTEPNSVDQHIITLLVKQDYMSVARLP